MTFTVRIKLGNDTMRTGDDIRSALYRIAQSVWLPNGEPEEGGISPVMIYDDNGNTVGEWSVTE